MRGLAGSAMFLLIGVGLVAFVKLVLGVNGDFIFVTLIILPILLWAIVTDRLSELALPGGTKAKFRRRGREALRTSWTKLVAVSSVFFAQPTTERIGVVNDPTQGFSELPISSRIQQLIRAESAQLIEVNLGAGDTWWSTRLLFLAALLVDYSPDKRLVFLSECKRGPGCWVGMATARAALGAMSSLHPDLAAAYRAASGRARMEQPASEQESDEIDRVITHFLFDLAPAGNEAQIKHNVSAEKLSDWLGPDLTVATVPWPTAPTVTIELLREILGYPSPYVPLVRRRRLMHIVDQNRFAARLAEAAIGT